LPRPQPCASSMNARRRSGGCGYQEAGVGRIQGRAQLVVGQRPDVADALECHDYAPVKATKGLRTDELLGPAGDHVLPRERRPVPEPNRLEEFTIGA
jgi:hypothetical protein